MITTPERAGKHRCHFQDSDVVHLTLTFVLPVSAAWSVELGAGQAPDCCILLTGIRWSNLIKCLVQSWSSLFKLDAGSSDDQLCSKCLIICCCFQLQWRIRYYFHPTADAHSGDFSFCWCACSILAATLRFFFFFCFLFFFFWVLG